MQCGLWGFSTWQTSMAVLLQIRPIHYPHPVLLPHPNRICRRQEAKEQGAHSRSMNHLGTSTAIQHYCTAVLQVFHQLPLLASTASPQYADDQEAEEEGAQRGPAGASHRDSVLLRICEAATWPPEHVSKILIALRDTPM